MIYALSDAVFGYRVRNATYRKVAEVSEQVASRDLKLLVDNGLLAPAGETRVNWTMRHGGGSMSRRVVLLGRMLWLMPVVALLWPSARAESQKATPSVKARIWQDERIGIVINKVEVGETLSPKVAESLKGPPDGPNGPFPTRARAGSKYVCIVFTLARVKGVYVFSFGPGVKLGAQESSLRDDGGRAYGLTYWRPSHFIITDVQDPTKARYHLPEAGTSIMIFEVPLDATPRSLTLFYAYTNSLADKDYKQGRLDITL